MCLMSLSAGCALYRTGSHPSHLFTPLSSLLLTPSTLLSQHPGEVIIILGYGIVIASDGCCTWYISSTLSERSIEHSDI